MTDRELAQKVGEETGVKPPSHQLYWDAASDEAGMGGWRCKDCDFYFESGEEARNKPCYARLLTDLNEAWKVLEVARGQVAMPFSITDACYGWRVKSGAFSWGVNGVKALCLAILKAAGKALGVKQ